MISTSEKRRWGGREGRRSEFGNIEPYRRVSEKNYRIMAARTPKIRPAPPAAFVRSALFFDGVEEPVGFKSLVSVPVPVVWTPVPVVTLSPKREKRGGKREHKYKALGEYIQRSNGSRGGRSGVRLRD